MIWILLLAVLVFALANAGIEGCLGVLGIMLIGLAIWGIWSLVDHGYDCTPRPNYSEECR